MLTKSRMKECGHCFYNYKEEELFINSSETKGVYPNIIEKIVEQLDTCLAIHKRVLVVRFDLSLNEYSGDNHTISTFINRQKQRMFKTYGVKNIGHAWKRERETSKAQHYHVALFIDGNKIQYPSKLLRQIKAKWFKHGRCWIPDECFYYLEFSFSNFKQTRGEAIYRLSYLGKTRGTGYKDIQAKNYSVSRLSR
ncbi:hypothetical protein GS41_03480 [Candidatus Pseudothioglobus singularis]|uniref:YagK/YfjJ domain-containing protein n=1 Tax=Candidatus Pseudothioglobus singularis TaxID=1427364 RepID=UPI0008060DF3|nr:inovirus-type Gp2 protein [Candidatus Pseudothioglobus singularis]ANQ66389.1 hypothetical protein GS41_03480 [Candidatus Pseudothioglobus singularis]